MEDVLYLRGTNRYSEGECRSGYMESCFQIKSVIPWQASYVQSCTLRMNGAFDLVNIGVWAVCLSTWGSGCSYICNVNMDNVFTSWCSDSRCFNLNLSDFKMLIVCVGALDWAHSLIFRGGWILNLGINGIGFLPKLIRALICWPYVKQVHILVDASFLWSSYLHEMSVCMHYWQDFFTLIL